MKHLIFVLLSVSLFSCNLPDEPTATPSSSSGVTKATTKVVTDLNGKTIEQNNIIGRLAEDNKPGAIKHLYIISAYSGQVLLYSTVKGKVTSSGKRLTPISVAVASGQYNAHDGFEIDIDGGRYQTQEVLQDDGTYGSSVEYVYWWDSKNIYHQIYPNAGAIITISNQPLVVKEATINFELTK